MVRHVGARRFFVHDFQMGLRGVQEYLILASEVQLRDLVVIFGAELHDGVHIHAKSIMLCCDYLFQQVLLGFKADFIQVLLVLFAHSREYEGVVAMR